VGLLRKLVQLFANCSAVQWLSSHTELLNRLPGVVVVSCEPQPHQVFEKAGRKGLEWQMVRLSLGCWHRGGMNNPDKPPHSGAQYTMAFTAGQYLLHGFFATPVKQDLVNIEDFVNILTTEIMLVAQVHAPEAQCPARQDTALTLRLLDEGGTVAEPPESRDLRNREAVGRARKDREPGYKELAVVYEKSIIM
jgi:hypothetical protein